MLRVACHTLGCRLNRCDTEALVGALRRHRPVTVVSWRDEADLYVLASCTVTAKAVHESRRLARQAKIRHPGSKVVVIGCYAQVRPEELAAMPEIDGVLGHAARDDVARWLPAVLDAHERPILVEPLIHRGPLAPHPPDDRCSGRSRGFLKIQDGCDLRCAYCQIWKARGPARSLPMAEALEHVRHLHRGSGFNEIVLTGVNLGAWGRDLRPRRSLSELLDALCREVPTVRLRLTSLHPDEIDKDLMSVLACHERRIRPHLHLSVQSGSDPVLKRMGRSYRSEDIHGAAAALAGIDPHFGLGADLIAGFPGETDEEFEATLELCELLPLSYLHVFRFSPRPGTLAAALKPVSADLVARRARHLRALGKAKHKSFVGRMDGAVREGILERGTHRATGLRRITLDNYAMASLDSDLAAGSLIQVRLTAMPDGSMTADLLKVIRKGR